jgi:hypothetical protein
MPAKMAMMAMTTSNSMSVKPLRGCRGVCDNNFMGDDRKVFDWWWAVNRIVFGIVFVIGQTERFSRVAGGVSLQLLNARTSFINPRPNSRE